MNNILTILLTILVAEITLVITIAGIIAIKYWWDQRQTEKFIEEFRGVWKNTFKENYS